MRSVQVVFDVVECSVEEVAAALTVQEGRPVTVQEVRRLECCAMRKLRAELRRRGLTADELVPDLER